VRFVYIAAIAATIASLRAKKVTQFPFFMGYLGVCGAASVSYAWGFSPTASESWWMWHWLSWQPILAISLIAAVGELAWWILLKIPEDDRSRLLLSMTWLAIGLTCVSSISLPARDSLILTAADLRHQLDLGIAIWMSVGCACLLVYGDRPGMFMADCDRHGVIFTGFCVMHAAVQQISPTWPTVSQMLFIDALTYTLSILCLLAWSLTLHASTRSSRVEGRLAV